MIKRKTKPPEARATGIVALTAQVCRCRRCQQVLDESTMPVDGRNATAVQGLLLGLLEEAPDLPHLCRGASDAGRTWEEESQGWRVMGEEEDAEDDAPEGAAGIGGVST